MMLGISFRRSTYGLRSGLSAPLPPICASRFVSLPNLHGSVVVFTSNQGNTENRSIINVSSIAGLHGSIGRSNYATAKSAVIGLTKTVAKEWGPFGVRANAIAFGLVHTRFAANSVE